MRGARARLALAHDGRAWAAHTTASLTRAPKIPPLRALLSDGGRPRTPEALFAKLAGALAAQGKRKG